MPGAQPCQTSPNPTGPATAVNRATGRPRRPCGRPTGARTSSWRRWPTNSATRWPRSATPCRSSGSSPDPAASEQARAMMERQVDQMVRLVDDLLDVTRITSGKLELRKERVDLRAVVEQRGGDQPPADRPDGPRPHRHAARTSRSRVDADPARLAQVFVNLLNNAAKYTRPGRAHPAGRRAAGERRAGVGPGRRHRHRRRPCCPASSNVLAGGRGRWRSRRAGWGSG